jgi:hypothetical protein
MFFHFAPLAEGTIVNARFTAQGGDPAGLDLSLAEGKLTLRLSSGDTSRQESLALKTGESDGFITVIVDFEIAPDRLGASLILKNPDRETKPLVLALPKPINGETVIRFGGTENSAEATQDTKGTAFNEIENETAIFSELAFSYARIPLQVEEPGPENSPALTESAVLPNAPVLSEHPTEEPSLPVR